MARKSRQSFLKRQRERQRAEKAAIKRKKREERRRRAAGEEPEGADPAVSENAEGRGVVNVIPAAAADAGEDQPDE